jgi:uncharacterized protein
MIKDDVLVFDCVAHPFNFDPSNALGQPGEQFINHLYAFHNVLTPESEPKLSAEEFLKEWSTAEIARMVFDESDTDMLVAMPYPSPTSFTTASPLGALRRPARREPRPDGLLGVREPFGIRYGDKRAGPSLVTRVTDAGTRG